MSEFILHPADKEFEKYFLRIDDNDNIPTVIQQIVKWKSAKLIKIIDQRTSDDVGKSYLDNILALPKLEMFGLLAARYFKRSYMDELEKITNRPKWKLGYSYPSKKHSMLQISKASELISKLWSKFSGGKEEEQEPEIQLEEHIIEAIHALLSEKPSEHQDELEILIKNFFTEQRNNDGDLISLTQNAL